MVLAEKSDMPDMLNRRKSRQLQRDRRISIGMIRHFDSLLRDSDSSEYRAGPIYRSIALGEVSRGVSEMA